MRALILGLAFFMTPSFSWAESACPKGNLLAKKVPSKSSGAATVRRITDNTMPAEGGSWNTAYTATLKGTTSFVTYDLGKTTGINSVLLQGDNNDTY